MLILFYSQDCHGSSQGNGAPIQDDTQNYIVDSGYQNATHTQIQFHRPLETCDPHDIIISVSIFLFAIPFFFWL